MKNVLLFFIGLIIGATICYLIIGEKSDTSDKNFFDLVPPTDSQITRLDKLKTSLRKKGRGVSRGLGTRISKSDAEDHINDFKSTQMALEKALQSLDVSLSSSYSFGLDEITSLCRDIEIINTRTQRDSLPGIRIHMGKSKTYIDGEPVYYIDAFMTPVSKKGVPIFNSSLVAYSDILDTNLEGPINAQSGGTITLNNSNPCPDVCE